MRQSEFARLLGISEAMVSKYKRDGLVTLRGREVDAEATLADLEGRVDDAKRKRALRRLAEMRSAGAATIEPPATDDGAEPEDPGSTSLGGTLSGKARLDAAKAELAEIELAETKGELIRVDETAGAVQDLIRGFFAEQDLNRRRESDTIAAELQLDAERTRKLRNLMTDRDRRVQRRFAERMARLAAEAEAAPSAPAQAAARPN